MDKKLILVSLNELNFDLIDRYIKKYNLSSFEHIKKKITNTSSESEYKLLEPWIQWLSIYLGLKAKDHGIFRLGNGIKTKNQSIFQILEKRGIKVGAISPMNIENNLVNPAYFIPDPWTNTTTSGGYWHNLVCDSISQLVKNNARKRLSIKNYLKFFIVFLRFSSLKNFGTYIQLFFKGIKKKWYRSLFLDFFLHELQLKLLKTNKANFSNIFFNSIAHIQHHYFFNSEVFADSLKKNPKWYISENEDPLKDALIIFNKILDDYLKIEKEYSLIIATGLRQVPYDTQKFYYRLRNHKKFFDNFNLKFEKIQELMSRDFVIEFKTSSECDNAAKIISEIKTTDNKKLFGDFDINENKLFLSLIFNEEILNQEIITKNKKSFSFKNFVDFVAIKNGMHDSKGYLYNNFIDLPNDLEIYKIKDLILNYYDS